MKKRLSNTKITYIWVNSFVLLGLIMLVAGLVTHSYSNDEVVSVYLSLAVLALVFIVISIGLIRGGFDDKS